MNIEQVASLATAAGVLIAAWQLYLSRNQARTAFEDSLAHEYRMLADKLPIEAFLGGRLSDADLLVALDEFYHYFDLCNSQIFMRQQGRISKKTWMFWSEGIRTNVSRPAFAQAWMVISVRAEEDFSELRKALSEGVNCDPKNWR